jgi:hypothetical protein
VPVAAVARGQRRRRRRRRRHCYGRSARKGPGLRHCCAPSGRLSEPRTGGSLPSGQELSRRVPSASSWMTALVMAWLRWRRRRRRPGPLQRRRMIQRSRQRPTRRTRRSSSSSSSRRRRRRRRRRWWWPCVQACAQARASRSQRRKRKQVGARGGYSYHHLVPSSRMIQTHCEGLQLQLE